MENPSPSPQPDPTQQPQEPATTQGWQTSAEYVQQRDAQHASALPQPKKSDKWFSISAYIYGFFLILLLLTSFTDFLAIQPPGGETRGRDYYAAARPVQGISLIASTIFAISTAILAVISNKKSYKVIGIVLFVLIGVFTPIGLFMLLLSPCMFSLHPCYVTGS